MKVPQRAIAATETIEVVRPTQRHVVRLMIDFMGPRVVVMGMDMGMQGGQLVKVRDIDRLLLYQDAIDFIERVDLENVSVHEAALDVLDAPQPKNERPKFVRPERPRRGGMDIVDHGTPPKGEPVPEPEIEPEQEPEPEIEKEKGGKKNG